MSYILATCQLDMAKIVSGCLPDMWHPAPPSPCIQPHRPLPSNEDLETSGTPKTLVQLVPPPRLCAGSLTSQSLSSQLPSGGNTTHPEERPEQTK